MEKETKKGIIVLVFIAIVCAYFIGQSSRSNSLDVNTAEVKSIQQETVTPSVSNPVNVSNVAPQSNLQMKMQCANYRKQIEDEYEKTSMQTGAKEIPILHQVVYSTSLNTCLSASYVLYSDSYYGVALEGSENLVIKDILTNKTIWSQNYKPSLKYWEAEAILNSQVSAIK